MSDTPRTDALFAQFGPVPHPAAMAYNSLSRELEREASRLRTQLHAVVIAHEQDTLTDRKILMARNALAETMPEKKWADKTPQEQNDALHREFGG